MGCSRRGRWSVLVSLVSLVSVLVPASPLAVAGVGPTCTVSGTEGDDVLEAGPLGDVVCGLGGHDVLISGLGDDVLIGGPGSDTVAFPDTVDGVRVDLRARASTGHGADELRTVENVRGTRGDDILLGDGGANSLVGRRGDDLLDGRRGPDALRGGVGDDTVRYAGSPKPVRADVKARRATGWGRDLLGAVENLIGSRHDDILYGSGAANLLEGRGGIDLLDGRKGRDLLRGLRGHDTLIGGAGADRLHGGVGRDSCLQGERRGPRKRSCEVLPLGGAAGVVLFMPADPVGATFHESLFRSAANMSPFGRLRRSDNPKFRRVPRTDGPAYFVMYSRGRPTGPTTASDFVVRQGARIRAPVTGTVTAVRFYSLYCSQPDRLLYLRPDGRPRIRVAMFHFGRVAVSPGDRVVAGKTVLGRAYSSGGTSAQENEYFPGPYPHVHLEIERGRAQPVPGCR